MVSLNSRREFLVNEVGRLQERIKEQGQEILDLKAELAKASTKICNDRVPEDKKESE